MIAEKQKRFFSFLVSPVVSSLFITCHLCCSIQTVIYMS